MRKLLGACLCLLGASLIRLKACLTVGSLPDSRRRLTWDENCGDTESLRQPSEGVIGPPGKDCEKDPASFLIMLEGDGGVLKLLNYM